MASLTMKEVMEHRSKEDLWMVHDDKVFDLTDFAGRHPGGAEVLLQMAGQDISQIMKDSESHEHSQFAYKILSKFYIGELIDNNNIPKSKTNGLNGIHGMNGTANGHGINGMNGMNGTANGHGPNTRGTERPPSETGGKRMLGWREEELVDWDKPLLGQVGKLGKDYLEWVHSPVDKHVRLFHSEFLEYFSDVYWYHIPSVWLPVCTIWMYLAFQHMLSNPHQVYMSWLGGGWTINYSHFPILFLFGILNWTLTEYILHRWLFHLSPPHDSPTLITLHFLLHGQHHKAPFDKYRLVFPPALASIFTVFFYSLFQSLMPPSMAYVVLSGMLFGYVCYDLTHYYLHHGTPFLSYFRNLKQYHIKHHFINQQRGFGISSKLWDYPFNTVLHIDNKKSK